MICLGIEGTAHTVGIGIVQDNPIKILSNVSSVYSPPSGGIHPREASNHHGSVFINVLKKSLENANIGFGDVDIIGFSIGPGLGPCLRTVATAARSLALYLKKPLLGVNHCIAHLEIGRAVTGANDPVLLYVSGGNTQVIAFLNGRYRVFGETLDIGIGNCLDKFGRKMGMKFPAGPKIEEMARKGKKYVPLPYSVKGMDVSFSGILTAAMALLRKESTEDICFSMQETCFSMLTEVAERAMAHTEKEEILLGGGVASNKRLQEMVKEMAEERGGKFYCPPSELLVDNGAMIAWTAILMSKSGIEMRMEDTAIKQNFRTDEVNITWRN
ncbi:MAG: bifunctional N(6)-L-threonylcarbamoyladenine synthase/serine/threonine protein kinase [Candidatus Thermoplasmatota archaeon]|nr:bifunctional N(6)-L-threonylcarbamoyladenine synthase/serine/threonine protein kinase [Candidatus Thermoplasmatota archaeon]